MRKRLLFMITALAVSGLMVLPSVAFAGHRIQDNGSGTVTLNRTDEGNTPEQATGTATFKVSSSGDGWYNMQMKLNVKNLPKKAGKVYEAWLEDTNSDSKDPVGAFQTTNSGSGGFTVNQRINWFTPYDEVTVSSENRNDSNPNQNGPVVLRGVTD
jgi:hypothetical protein